MQLIVSMLYPSILRFKHSETVIFGLELDKTYALEVRSSQYLHCLSLDASIYERDTKDTFTLFRVFLFFFLLFYFPHFFSYFTTVFMSIAIKCTHRPTHKVRVKCISNQCLTLQHYLTYEIMQPIVGSW